MTASALNMSALTDPLNNFQIHRRTSTMESSRRSIFGSLRSSLSRNKHNTGNDMQSPSHSQAKSVTSPPTRRPAAPSSNPFHDPSSFDAPPAYSAAPAAAPAAAPQSGPSPVRSSAAPVADDAYAFLDEFDTIFLIDDSGSMAGGLWRQTADAIMTIAPICTAHDKDGVDIYFLNHTTKYKNVTSSTTVREIFQTVRPGGATPTGRRLNTLLKDYMENYTAKPDTTKPINIICITDGEPSDDDETPLINTAKKLDKLDAPAWQVGIQFFQVGSDPKASLHLKELDDELASIAGEDDMRDIVDTVPFTDANGGKLTADGILKVVLGAVTRRLDRRSKELHQ